MNVYQIVLLCVGGLAVLGFLYILIFKRDWLKYYNISKPIVTALYGVVSAISTVFPSVTLTVIQTVMKATIKATGLAEELWQSGELPKEERNAYAKKYITDVLSEAGIEITDQVNQIVDGVIAMVCMILPHNSTSAE